MTPADRKYLESRQHEQNAAFKQAWRAAAPEPTRGSVWPFVFVAAIVFVICWWGWTGP